MARYLIRDDDINHPIIYDSNTKVCFCATCNYGHSEFKSKKSFHGSRDLTLEILSDIITKIKTSSSYIQAGLKERQPQIKEVAINLLMERDNASN
jgi:hypothetical protein